MRDSVRDAEYLQEEKFWPAKAHQADMPTLPTSGEHRPTADILPVGIDPGEVRSQMARILGSAGFANSRTLSKVLVHVVEKALAGELNAITERSIAVAVLNKRDYDTKVDASVRMAFQRLRRELREYYHEHGADDPVLILLAPGCYVPRFRKNRTLDTLRPSTANAWDLYVEARALWATRAPDALRAAVKLLEQALAEDPKFVGGHAGLAECYAFLALSGQAPSEVMPLASLHADAALELDPDNATAHAVRGFVACAYHWKWEEAEAEMELAITLDRRSTAAYCWHASYLVAVGRFSEAILQCRRAQATETVVSLVTNSHVAKILNVAGDHEGALNLLIRLIEQAPGFFLTHWQLGLLFLETGQLDRGILELQSAVDLSGGMAAVVASLAYARAIAGEHQEARSLLRQLLDRRSGEYVAAPDVAVIYGALGDLNEAFAWLEQARLEKAVFLTWLAAWPLFGPLRADLRYRTVLKSIGL